jgi:hypothetical protein
MVSRRAISASVKVGLGALGWLPLEPVSEAAVLLKKFRNKLCPLKGDVVALDYGAD